MLRELSSVISIFQEPMMMFVKSHAVPLYLIVSLVEVVMI